MNTGRWSYHFFALHAHSVNTPLTDFRIAHIAGNISCGLMYPCDLPPKKEPIYNVSLRLNKGSFFKSVPECIRSQNDSEFTAKLNEAKVLIE